MMGMLSPHKENKLNVIQ